jgi:hypothetical protein
MLIDALNIASMFFSVRDGRKAQAELYLFATVFYAGNWGILMNRLPTYRYPMLRKEYLAGIEDAR